MAAKEKGQLYSFLQDHMVGSLATIRPNGQPHVSTIYYMVNRDLKFFFVTKDKTVKFTNIKKNSHIALVISDEQTLDTVQVEGIARIVHGAELLEATEGLIQKVVRTHKQWDTIPISLIKPGHFSFFTIEPFWIRWMNYKNWNDTVEFEYQKESF